MMPCLSCAERRRRMKAYVARKLGYAKPVPQAQPAQDAGREEAPHESGQQAGEQDAEYKQRAVEADKGSGPIG